MNCLSEVFGCEGQYLIGWMLVGIIVALAVITGIWAYWDAYRERQKMRRTPMAIRRIPLSGESSESYPGQRKLTRFRSHAFPAKKSDRWPMRGLDRLLNSFFRGGSISGW